MHRFWQPKPVESSPLVETPPNTSASGNADSSERPGTTPTPEHGAVALFGSDWHALTRPQNLLTTAILTSTILLARRVYKTHLRRIPNVDHLNPRHFTDLSRYASMTRSSSTTSQSASAKHANAQRQTAAANHTPQLPLRTSLLGICTSANDPDNFRLYHTPLGRLALWRAAVPTARKDLKDQTLHIRIAGIDAPELAHFGKPAQPYGEEALVELRSIVEGKRVRVWLLRRDQYGRVVGLAFVARSALDWLLGGLKEEGWSGFWRRDVGLEMLRRGAATVYEGSYGAEYGGWERERRYRAAEAEARKHGLGMWAATKLTGAAKDGRRTGWARILTWLEWLGGGRADEVPKGKTSYESPRDYKKRMIRLEEGAAAEKKTKKT